MRLTGRIPAGSSWVPPAGGVAGAASPLGATDIGIIPFGRSSAGTTASSPVTALPGGTW